jgi:hypothetical protein
LRAYIRFENSISRPSVSVDVGDADRSREMRGEEYDDLRNNNPRR